jgi:hypothetical protein
MARTKKLTPRESILLKALSKGCTLADAAKAAGYSDKNLSQSGYQCLEGIKAKMPEILDAKGLTQDSVIERYLMPALEANETQFFANKGIVFDSRDTISWGPRLTALDLYFRLRGSYAPKDDSGGTNLSVNIVNLIDRPNRNLPAISETAGVPPLASEV